MTPDAARVAREVAAAGLTYGELLMLTEGHGTSVIYERITAALTAARESHGPKCDVARRRGRAEEALAMEQMRMMRDGCEVCDGAQGGVPGNENRIEGRVVCDYCHAFYLKGVEAGRREERARWRDVGWHSPSCPAFADYEPCVCGWDALRAEPEATP